MDKNSVFHSEFVQNVKTTENEKEVVKIVSKRGVIIPFSKQSNICMVEYEFILAPEVLELPEQQFEVIVHLPSGRKQLTGDNAKHFLEDFEKWLAVAND